MALTVSNTLTGEREAFEPVDPSAVTLYYCGLTVSDDAHLGHARSWVHTDVMHRWLEHCGYTVDHVENFTDVNEKIVAQVGEDEDEAAVARRYIGRVLGDMRSLRLKRVSVYPRVTEHIPEIVDLIERLLDRDVAYEANGSVYFDVTAFPEYGRLSNQSLEELEADEDDATAEKRHPADFALWKAGGVAPEDVTEHLQGDHLSAETACERALTFESPWSEGRPGWHIECSAMATSHLGETFDIHVAGRDIVFPHNENEIAQAVAATDGEYARYWLHTGLLRTEGEKMSSSLRNFFRVRDAVAEYGPDVLRTFYLSTHYRADQTFSEEAIEEASARWDRLAEAYARATAAADSADAGTKTVDEDLRAAVESARADVTAAMNDDFDTREALSALLAVTTAVNGHVGSEPPHDYAGLRSAIELFEEIGGDVFGLDCGDREAADVRLAHEVIDILVDLREEARAAGEYDRADAIRDDLAAVGVTVEDAEGGSTYHVDR